MMLKMPSALLFFSLATLGFVSCAEKRLSVVEVKPYIIYDMESDSMPQDYSRQFLAVFVQTEREAVGKSMRIANKESGLEWESFDLRNPNENSCCALFAPCAPSAIPLGNYDLHFTDANGNVSSSSFSIEYADASISVPVDLEEFSASFDSDMRLVSFGTSATETASAVRRCFVSGDKKVVYLFPIKKQEL